ncbi:MAG: VC1465 family Xer recombination activation factor [Pseudomonadota bacterium]
MLQVTTRTMRNWENGSSRIPYSAFRLMRLYGGHAIVDKAWDGWSIHQGVLYGPAGRGFEPYQLNYLGNYLWMARQWLKERAAAKAAEIQTSLSTRVAKPSISELETLTHDEACDATASSGSRLHQTFGSLNGNIDSLQGKNLTAQKFGNWYEIRTIAEAANDMIHSEVR